MWKEKASYISIGTQDPITGTLTPITLTANYADNQATHLSKYLDNVSIDIYYTSLDPANTGFMYLLLEISNDEGKTWVTYVNKLQDTDQTDLYAVDFNGDLGNPVIVPGTKNGQNTTLYSVNFQATLVADYIRISVKDESGTPGTVSIRTTLTNNQ